MTPMGRLLSVNVGLPREVSWRGRAVHTAIFKEPVAGRRMARRLNVDGDGQADLTAHGGEHRAIYVYDEASLRHWERELGRADLGPGSFGENFTVSGLADDAVCIGDAFRIGGAVFEVTQPRVTCFKIGMKLDEPRMPALMYAHGRPGFYLRVLEEGEVGEGDAIERVAAGPGAVTVREASALLYLPGHDRARIADALAIPALSQGWRTSFAALLDGDSGLVAPAPAPAWQGFRPFTVARVADESPDVRSFELEPVDGEALPEHAPGMAVTVRLPSATRSYSLSAADDPARYRISVKRLDGGLASTYLHERVAPGDVIELGAPRGAFVLDAGGEGAVVLASAGVGITPLLAMLASLARAGSTRPVWWLHGARDGATLAFATEVDALLGRLRGARRLLALSRPAPGDSFDHAGRLDIEAVRLLGAPRDADYYLCGPARFMSDLAAALADWGVAPGRLHQEAFGPAQADPDRRPHAPAGAPGDGPLVSFARAGLAVPWDERFASLLDLAEACDVPADWSCRTGVCHRCETTIVEGDVDYFTEPLDPPAPGRALLCSSRPRGPVTVDL
jgi:ferredoxin-NADP reductase/MOSC domain-containing protein YiiM/ferredoxin